jgi:general secretion pathway protein B
MSLILEALKKSEAERLRRQSPGLLTPDPVRRRARVWPWLLAGLMVLVALAGGWWLGQRGAAEAPIAPAPAPAPETRPEVLGAASDTPSAPAPSAPSHGLGLPESARPPPALPQVRVRPGERESAPMIAPSAPDPLSDPDLDPDTRARLAKALAERGQSAAGVEDAAERPGGPQTPDPRATTASPAAVPQPGPDALPLKHELPFALRRDLPDLRVSMVVSSGDAGARFALVNGERRVEGDEIAPGVRLISIRAQGLELEFRGQRFLLQQGR